MEASRAQLITTQQQQPAPNPPYIGTANLVDVVTVRVTCLWWRIGSVYWYAGATTPTQKRYIRHDVQRMAEHGVEGIYKDKRGRWHVASAVALVRYQDHHEAAMRRQGAEAERRKMVAERREADLQRREADAKRQSADIERTTPPRHLRLQAASFDVERTQGGESQSETSHEPALQDV
jgi:hypothetical protein